MNQNQERPVLIQEKTALTHENSYVNEDGFTITQGDIIKVKGEYGIKFKFWCLTTNPKTGAQWVDCFEVFRGQAGAFRSFRPERIKRIPKKRVKK